MILFHGTSTRFRTQIMRNGLQPRIATGRSVYAGKEAFGKQLESSPDRIYLTDVYPVQFGTLAVQTFGGSVLVLAVDVDESALLPDTDFLHCGTGIACLRHAGTCSIITDRIQPVRMYQLAKREIDAVLLDSTYLKTGLVHNAMRERLEGATHMLLMCAKRRWDWRDGAWDEKI